MAGEFRPPTGHVFRVERARGPAWYAKYRLPDGRQVQKKVGPARRQFSGRLSSIEIGDEEGTTCPWGETCIGPRPGV
jgi:hypothetical protein